MGTQLTLHARRIVQYDPRHHRLWILGQRCHHGATGSLVTSIACAVLLAERQVGRSLMALAATGAVLMAHDWNDHSIWFERGYGSQR
jgi:hypothetical protein